MIPDLTPMLAERGLPNGSLDRWAAEWKLDGWRCTVTVRDGRVTLRTRRGHDITDRLPSVEAIAQLGCELLLDGKLVAGAGRTRDFYSLAPRLAGRPRRSAAPVSFWAFDLLWLDGDLLTGRPYVERRQALESLTLAGPCGVVPRYPTADVADLVAGCVHHDVEGIVLKRLTSRDYPGERRRCWLKVKAPGWAAVHAQRRRPS